MFKMAKSIEIPPRQRRLAALMHVGLLAGCLSVGSSANAALSFVFDYAANNGNTEYLGAGNQNRRDALQTAGTLFSSYFGSLFSNSGTITLAVQGTNSSCQFGCTLASAGTSQVYNTTGFGNTEVVRNKVLNGVDLNGAGNDGLVSVNWGAPWELDPGVSVAAQNAGNFDFYAALFHEFTHALGFFSNLTQAGDDGSPSGGITTPGFWSKFDQFLTDCQGTDLIDHNTFLTNSVYADASISANGKSLCFSGANALAGNGGNSGLLFAPNPYSGSTNSHLDPSGGNTTAMMKPGRSGNVDEARTYNTLEVGIMKDIGYTLNAVGAVPEPGTLALVLAALAGLTIRRRKA